MSSASAVFVLLIEDASGASGMSFAFKAEQTINRQRVATAISDFELSGI